jgi:hypothetical protein
MGLSSYEGGRAGGIVTGKRIIGHCAEEIE